MSQIPRDKDLDSTLALAFDGYHFGEKRRCRNQSDVFETRLRLRNVICMSGGGRPKYFTIRIDLNARVSPPHAYNRRCLAKVVCRGWMARHTGGASRCSWC